jgi:excisionase family DNA binding protein
MTSTMPMPMLKVRDFAADFNVSPRTVLLWIEHGEVAAVRVRGTIRIPLSERNRLLVATTVTKSA